MLRDPVAPRCRATTTWSGSATSDARSRSRSTRSTKSAWPTWPTTDGTTSGSHRRACRGYLARGRYAEQLERWWARFPRDQLLVIESSELAAGDAFERVLQFLGLDATTGATVTPDRNVGSYTAPPPALVDRLAEHFAPHNERLFALLGRRWDWPARGA